MVEHKVKSRGNGTGSVYRLPNGKWRAAVTLGYDTIDEETKKRKRIYKTKSGFKTKKEALDYLPTLRGSTVKATDPLFREVYTEWIAVISGSVSDSTRSGYENCYNKYCESLKHKRMSAIKVSELQKCIDECPQSPRMKQLLKVTLTSIYKYAEQNDYVTKNYASFIKLPKQIKPDKDAFTDKEISQIWDKYLGGNTFMRYTLIMIYTGLRPAELRQLSNEKIDLEKKVITAGLKTEKGTDRKIPICDKIIPLLRNANFSFDRNKFYKLYKAAFEKTEIRYLPPHCCRHTAATALVLAGVEHKIIQDILGHSSFSVTADNYVHVPIESMIDAVNKIK